MEEDEADNKELFEHYKIIVDPGQAQLRVDKFLMDKVENTSRNKLQEAASAGNIHVNNIAVKSNYKVKPGDVVQIVLEHPPREIELIPQDIPIDILYEDDDLILVNKPAGLVVHPGYGNYSGTLVNALVYHFENLPNQSELGNRPGLVHRIDKNTSGILVIAKTESSMTHLAKQFYDRTIDRRYLALVWGDVKEDGVKVLGQNESPNAEYDVYSNAIGFRITDDMRIGYRTIRYTGACQTTGTTCDSGKTFNCGYGIEESYSGPICPFISKSGKCDNTWIQVDVVFERNLALDECEIYNNGGVNDLIKIK